MKPSELLSALCLIIVVLLPLSLMWLLSQRESWKNTEHLKKLHLLEIQRSQTVLNLLLAPNFQVFAGMQQSQPSPVNSTPWLNSASEYIPRDDTTEALRIQELGKAFGVGEALFEEDPDLTNMLSEMRAAGQIDYGEGG